MADPTPRHLPPTIRSKASTWPAAAYFFMWALLGLLIWLLLWLALVAGQFGQVHPDNSWVKEAYALKFAAAEQYLGQKKLLVVGGSASMFGVRSPDLASAFDLPTVNLGVNAGLGTYEVPARVDKWIEPGDLVVMPLEYRLLLWDGVPSYVTLSWALEHPETLRRWSAKSLLWGLWSLPLKRVFEVYLSNKAMPRGLGPYGAHRLDQWGDQTRTAATFRSDVQRQALADLPAERYDELYAVTSTGLNEWHYWWRRWQERGACLVVVPPPFMRSPAYASPSFSAFFDAIPQRVMQRGVTYLGHPRDGFFPVEAMFDTNYHLTDESRDIYTRRLIASLRSSNLSCLSETPRGDTR
jgi:hypothetical protein